MAGVKSIYQDQGGFSLVEVIATLVILGIIGLGVSAYFVYSVENFVLSRAGNETYQKASLALERMARETKQMDTVYAIDSDSMRFARQGTDFGLAKVGKNLKLIRSNTLPSQNTGAVLMDNVTAFSLTFITGDGSAWTVQADSSLSGLSRVVISLTVSIPDTDTSRTFTIDINPLYNNTVNTPTS